MALSAAQKADIRFYAGWQARYLQLDSRLEQAMNAIELQPEHEAQITNTINASPPGLLALLKDIDTKLRDSHGRLKASVVGSITLNRAELYQLRSEGRRFVGRLCSILGVCRGEDVFGSGSSGGSNYIGK